MLPVVVEDVQDEAVESHPHLQYNININIVCNLQCCNGITSTHQAQAALDQPHVADLVPGPQGEAAVRHQPPIPR